MIVKFHTSTGVVLVQGAGFSEWQAEMFAPFKNKVNAMCADAQVALEAMEYDQGTVPKVIDGDEQNPMPVQPTHSDNAQNRDDSVVMSNDESAEYSMNQGNHGDADNDADVQYRADNGSDCDTSNTKSDIQKLEDAYIRVCDITSANIGDLKSDMIEIRSEMRKMPLKISDHIRKDMQSIMKSVSDLTAAVSQCDSYRTHIAYLTEQLQNQRKEIWSLRKDIAHLQNTRANPGGITRSPGQTPSPASRASLSTGLTDAPSPAPSAVPAEPIVRDGGVNGTVRSSHDMERSEAGTSPPMSRGHSRRDTHVEVSATRQPPPRQPQGHRPSNPLHCPPVAEPQSTTVTTTIPLVEQRNTGEQTATPLIGLPEYRTPIPIVPLDSESSSDSGSETDTPNSNDDGEFREQRRSRGQRDRNKHQADAILITDSNGKYIDPRRFLGKNTNVYHDKAAITGIASKMLQSWTKSDRVKYCVLHCGINDVRSGKAASEIVKNIEQSLGYMTKCFPCAKTGFSEILYIGKEIDDPKLNAVIKETNKRIKEHCVKNGHIFINHTSLQNAEGNLFDDIIHVNRSGTAVLVSDIHRALGLHSREDSTGQGRVFVGSSAGPRLGIDGIGFEAGASEMPARHRRHNRGYQNKQPSGVNLNQMLQLMTLNLLNSFSNSN